MKYCVSARQPYSVLQKADEIKVQWQDRFKIMDFIEKLPDKTIILECDTSIPDSEWATLEMYNEKLDLILMVYNCKIIPEILEHGLRFYWGYPIQSFWELDSIAPFKPEYVLIGMPLSFDLEQVKKFRIPVRLVPNVAYFNIIPRDNGICGQWIRPEDVKKYERYIDVLEFEMCDLQGEANLLHIYKENQSWPGNLNLLFANFNVNVDNRALPEDLGERRMNCGQRCVSHGTCHKCESAVRWSETLRKEHELRQKDID